MTAGFAHAVVTGGAGFLGGHLCRRLLASGGRVTCVDDFSTGSSSVAAELEAAGARVVRQSVTEDLVVPEPVDLVLHLACPASPAAYLGQPVQTLRTSSEGTWNALRLAQQHGARFVLASTSEVYGDPLEHPQREGYWGNVNPIGPRSVYDEGKRYAESLTRAYAAENAIDAAIVRIFNTYGPGMRPDDGRMIPTFIGQAVAGKALTVAGSGEQTRSLCYVDDTVSGVLALAESLHAGPVNIGNPDEVSVREVAEKICLLAGRAPEFRYIPGAVDDPRRRCPDVRLAGELLAWQPEVSLDDGLRRTIVGWNPAGGAPGAVDPQARTHAQSREART